MREPVDQAVNSPTRKPANPLSAIIHAAALCHVILFSVMILGIALGARESSLVSFAITAQGLGLLLAREVTENALGVYAIAFASNLATYCITGALAGLAWFSVRNRMTT